MHRVAKLKNGLTLITVPVKGTSATTVLCMFPVGSRFEEPRTNGAAHFVEHMLFKGTTKRPTSQDITRTFDAVGAQYNAFTSKEYTGYYVKVAAEKQSLAFEVLADMLANSVFKLEEVEKEKGAIVEELRMYKDNPLMDIDDTFESLVFEGHPLGWNIGGSEDTVRGMSREDLVSYYQAHYSPRTMVLVVAGAVDSKKLASYVKHFLAYEAPRDAATFSWYKAHTTPFDVPPVLPLEKRVTVKEKKVDQLQLMLGFPAFEHTHADRYALSVLSTVLGGGMSSRLFTEVRERRGLAYMVKTDTTSYRETGVFSVKAGLDPARVPEALRVIVQELKKIVAEPVSTQELKDAQNYLLGHTALQLEDSFNQANWFAERFLFMKRLDTYQDVAKKIKKVTIKDVHKVAKQVIRFNELRLAAIGGLSKEVVIKAAKDALAE